ncbi:MAG: helix-turn-helix transcriptional regulator, partial [Deltaproteobacteria bacterium]|nr:helix-turn-helix transcriptional regulator [Deltaproteobacteria bacterium]
MYYISSMAPFGETVLLWRLKRGLTQSELARRAGVPRPNLSAIERGQREVSLKTVRALALALDVRAGVLVDGIAPEGEGAGELSREAMERIAAAVIRKSPLADAKEQVLADQLKHLVSSRLRAARPVTKGSTKRLALKGAARLSRGSDRAWLSLSSYPQAVIESL